MLFAKIKISAVRLIYQIEFVSLTSDRWHKMYHHALAWPPVMDPSLSIADSARGHRRRPWPLTPSKWTRRKVELTFIAADVWGARLKQLKQILYCSRLMWVSPPNSGHVALRPCVTLGSRMGIFFRSSRALWVVLLRYLVTVTYNNSVRSQMVIADTQLSAHPLLCRLNRCKKQVIAHIQVGVIITHISRTHWSRHLHLAASAIDQSRLSCLLRGLSPAFTQPDAVMWIERESVSFITTETG